MKKNFQLDDDIQKTDSKVEKIKKTILGKVERQEQNLTEMIRKNEQMIFGFDNKVKQCIQKIEKIEMLLSDISDRYTNHEYK